MSRPGPSKPAVARRPITGPARRTLNTSGIARSSSSANGKPDDGYLYVAGVRDQSKRVAEYRTDSDTCPICHTDRQFNKNLRLLISPCYHKMCESCIDRLFTLGPEPCPQCGKILRKVNFAHQTFEDLKVEKEVAVRRRMAECYNKRADDFASSKEYDDFLEQAEDITFNLLNDIDLEKTEARIAEFMQKNAKSIAANKQKAQRELLSLNEREEEIKRDKDLWRKQIEQSEIFEEREEQRVKREIVEAMARQAHATVEDIKTRAAEAKLIRERNLIASIPPSLVDLLPNRLKLHHVNNAQHQTVQLDTDDPLSVHYNGPFVPFAYSDPSKAEWSEWYDLLEDYVDGRKGVMDVKKDKEGKFRGGGFDLKLFWEMEVRSAVESLGVEPL